jgi:phosphatidylserine/phosphatidylglycerophosphate/cardiolipin synthase-like enzyme
MKEKSLITLAPGWTFHAKGIWYYLPGETLPSATLIGSPNFGFRSVEKDLEAQITIVTTNPELRRDIDAEQVENLIKTFKSAIYNCLIVRLPGTNALFVPCRPFRSGSNVINPFTAVIYDFP